MDTQTNRAKFKGLSSSARSTIRGNPNSQDDQQVSYAQDSQSLYKQLKEDWQGSCFKLHGHLTGLSNNLGTKISSDKYWKDHLKHMKAHPCSSLQNNNCNKISLKNFF